MAENNQEQIDQEKTAQIRRMLANENEAAVRQRFGEQEVNSPEFREAERQLKAGADKQRKIREAAMEQAQEEQRQQEEAERQRQLEAERQEQLEREQREQDPQQQTGGESAQSDTRDSPQVRGGAQRNGEASAQGADQTESSESATKRNEFQERLKAERDSMREVNRQNQERSQQQDNSLSM